MVKYQHRIFVLSEFSGQGFEVQIDFMPDAYRLNLTQTVVEEVGVELMD